MARNSFASSSSNAPSDSENSTTTTSTGSPSTSPGPSSGPRNNKGHASYWQHRVAVVETQDAVPPVAFGGQFLVEQAIQNVTRTVEDKYHDLKVQINGVYNETCENMNAYVYPSLGNLNTSLNALTEFVNGDVMGAVASLERRMLDIGDEALERVQAEFIIESELLLLRVANVIDSQRPRDETEGGDDGEVACKAPAVPRKFGEELAKCVEESQAQIREEMGTEMDKRVKEMKKEMGAEMDKLAKEIKESVRKEYEDESKRMRHDFEQQVKVLDVERNKMVLATTSAGQKIAKMESVCRFFSDRNMNNMMRVLERIDEVEVKVDTRKGGLDKAVNDMEFEMASISTQMDTVVGFHDEVLQKFDKVNKEVARLLERPEPTPALAPKPTAEKRAPLGAMNAIKSIKSTLSAQQEQIEELKLSDAMVKALQDDFGTVKKMTEDGKQKIKDSTDRVLATRLEVKGFMEQFKIDCRQVESMSEKQGEVSQNMVELETKINETGRSVGSNTKIIRAHSQGIDMHTTILEAQKIELRVLSKALEIMGGDKVIRKVRECVNETPGKKVSERAGENANDPGVVIILNEVGKAIDPALHEHGYTLGDYRDMQNSVKSMQGHMFDKPKAGKAGKVAKAANGGKTEGLFDNHTVVFVGHDEDDSTPK